MGKVNFQTIWFQTEYCMILLGLRRFLFQITIQKQQYLKKTLRNISEHEIRKFLVLPYVPKLFVKNMCVF